MNAFIRYMAGKSLDASNWSELKTVHNFCFCAEEASANPQILICHHFISFMVSYTFNKYDHNVTNCSESVNYCLCLK